MPAMFIILIPLLTILQTGFALECLQCSGISQPRHCRIVSTCDADEICGVQQVTTLHGRNVYNVGCVAKQHCLGSNTNHGDGCLTCCDSNLCNAAGCGEPGYPANIGPVCYNCPSHTHLDTCNAIEVCEPGMVCRYDFRRDFGELVYSGQCAEKHTCSPDTVDISTLVGRRSLNEHVCHGCCDTDLCNKQCDALISRDPCDPSPCINGTCVAVNGHPVCICNQGYIGNLCDSRDECEPNPCSRNGSCLNYDAGYTCVCANGTYGDYCEYIDACQSSPCVHGYCAPNGNNYTCLCSLEYQGRNCELDHCLSNPCVNGKCFAQPHGYTCSCYSGYGGTTCNEDIASDCLDLYRRNSSLADGVYNIILWKSRTIISVYCVMTSAGGGWTVFQNRFDGSVDFYRELSNYTEGFGNVPGEYWLGLKFVKELADQGTSTIRMEVTAADGTSAYEEWPEFILGDAPGYRLHVGGPGSGTAGDENKIFYLGNNHADFTGKGSDVGDRDQGGWWYATGGTNINLNGPYMTPGSTVSHGLQDGPFMYYSFKQRESLKASRMMLKRT